MLGHSFFYLPSVEKIIGGTGKMKSKSFLIFSVLNGRFIVSSANAYIFCEIEGTLTQISKFPCMF